MIGAGVGTVRRTRRAIDTTADSETPAPLLRPALFALLSQGDLTTAGARRTAAGRVDQMRAAIAAASDRRNEADGAARRDLAGVAQAGLQAYVITLQAQAAERHEARAARAEAWAPLAALAAPLGSALAGAALAFLERLAPAPLAGAAVPAQAGAAPAPAVAGAAVAVAQPLGPPAVAPQ